ncbi:hypothetical protein FRC04_001513 [Tulasnella sp. 424]|nr:hypothetical protein FRC04_001513 [Tulasnella sp. 424]KAG8974578.1 hypothetical protein FRC05_007210 [Tulasnella sp. 425]
MIPTAKLALLLNALLVFSAVSVYGAPINRKREVPQEHSHEKFLTSVRASLAKNNPDGIVDPVFGLLGNAAATQGLGKITDPDCLQQATADQAFTNAKAAGDVQGQVDALIYRALERNTGKVGLASVACTAIKATNPEIAAISQHQDPASANAASVNKGIVLELAKQIAAVGGDPQQALESGTFAPGDVNDATAKGNTCDDANDPTGCIFTQNLLVEDATAAEIDAAVQGVASGDESKAATTTAAAAADTTTAAAATITDAATATATDAAATGDVVTVTVTVTVTDGAAAATSTAAAADTTAAAADTTAAAATTTAAADAAATSAASSSDSTLDFGSCSNPTIEFGLGFDGRTENSFRPVNSADFNHGSALNIKVIADFICQQLNDKCKASAATITACQSGEAAAIAKGAVAEAADVFNAALGFGAASSSSGASATQAAATTAKAAATTTKAAATTTTAAAAATTTAAASSGSSTANLQTFTDALGSITPPAVTKTGSSAQPFCVDGNSCFSSLQNALVRSCDVQHNKCANASNGAGQNKAFSVEDCGNQQTTCNQNATATASA